MTKLTPVPPDDPLMKAARGVVDAASHANVQHYKGVEFKSVAASKFRALEVAADRARDANLQGDEGEDEGGIDRADATLGILKEIRSFCREFRQDVAGLIDRIRGGGEDADSPDTIEGSGQKVRAIAERMARLADDGEETHEAGQLERMSRRVLDAVVDYINATGNPVTKIEADLEGEPGGIPERVTFSFYPKGGGGDHARPGDLVRIGNCLAAQEVLRAGQGWVVVAPDASLWIGPDRYEVVCRKDEIEKG